MRCSWNFMVFGPTIPLDILEARNARIWTGRGKPIHVGCQHARPRWMAAALTICFCHTISLVQWTFMHHFTPEAFTRRTRTTETTDVYAMFVGGHDE